MLSQYLSPGIYYLLTQAHKPLILVFCVLCVEVASLHVGTPLSTWQSTGLSMALGFVFSQISGWLEKRKWEREAKAAGARLAPVAPGKWPFSIDIVWEQMTTLEHGYPGAYSFHVRSYPLLI